jgi:hypothetical protein
VTSLFSPGEVTLSDVMKGKSDFPLFSSGEVTPFGFIKKG